VHDAVLMSQLGFLSLGHYTWFVVTCNELSLNTYAGNVTKLNQLQPADETVAAAAASQVLVPASKALHSQSM
jgi:hypothetical protein